MRQTLNLLTLALLSVFYVLPGALHAQPTADIITYTGAESLLPAGIVFRLEGNIAPDTEISLLTLSVDPEGAPSAQFNVPLDDETVFTRAADEIFVDYVWQFRRASEIPDPFTDVTYRWTLTLDDGRTDTIDGEVEFIDKRINWRENRANGIGLRLYVPDEAVRASAILNALEEPYTLMTRNTQPIDEITVVIYGDETVLGCEMSADDKPEPLVSEFYGVRVPCDPDVADDVYDSVSFTLLPSRGRTPDDIAMLTDLLVVSFYREAWEDADVPAWFKAGLARLYDPTDNTELLSLTQFAARNESLLSLNEMAAAPPAGTEAYALWEAQGYGLVAYAAELHGLDTVYRLARLAGNADTFADAYETATDQTVAALYAAWETWLFADNAPDVYGLDLYGFPTLTPTPPRTPTPSSTFLPTSTPTNTPTITRTPSITPTPSDTPTPTPTITFTPRPARSVFTPTPTFTPSPAERLQQAVDQTTAFYVLLGVMVVSVLLVLVGMVLHFRRR